MEANLEIAQHEIARIDQAVAATLSRLDIDPHRLHDPTPVMDPRGLILDRPEAVQRRLEIATRALRHEADGEFDTDRLPPLHEFTAEWVQAQKRDPREAPWLILFGCTGCGKTSQLFGGVRELVLHHARANRPYRWAIMSHRNFTAAVRPGGYDADAVMERLMTVDLLALPDLGDYNTQDFGRAVDYTARLINHRWQHRLATIYDTNLLFRRDDAVIAEEQRHGVRIATLSDTLDGRVISRLEAGWIAPLPEMDYRAAQGRVMGL